MTLPEVIKTAKKFGCDGIEIDGKRPHGNPLDWPAKSCRELGALADGEGIEILGVAANKDISSPSPEVREAQLCYLHSLTYELCHDLPQVNGQTADIDFVHENSRLAAQFMRDIIMSQSA